MPSDALASWNSALKEGLRDLENRSQKRSLQELRGVNLCSNDYLGLAEHPVLREAVIAAMETATRVGGTGSRLLSGQSEDWKQLEEEFARFAGTEASLYFGSGYAANLGLLTSLVGKDDVVFSDELNHASLIDGMRLTGAKRVIYPHLDLNALEAALRQDSGAPWRKAIVTESVFSMNGDVAPLRDMIELAEKYGAVLIVDEAHATAVHGPRGSGIAAAAELQGRLMAVVHTCGKALASAGAFVCGSAVLKDHLINHARTFIFTTAQPPYLAGQIRAAMNLAAGMDRERAELQQRAEWLARELRFAGFDTAGSASQIVPAILGKNDDTMDAAEFLQREGFAVRGIRPPTIPEGKARLRFSLTSKISAAEISRLKETLVEWRARQEVAAAVRNA
jgi:8-amino-7-oxononanoate synthase